MILIILTAPAGFLALPIWQSLGEGGAFLAPTWLFEPAGYLGYLKLIKNVTKC